MRVVLKLGVLAGIALTLSTPSAFPQELVPAKVRAFRQDGSTQQFYVFPKALVGVLFQSGDVILELVPGPERWLTANVPFLDGVQFAKLIDTGRRFSISAMVYGDHIFTFGNLFYGENPPVMNQFLCEANIHPNTSEESLGIAKLFLALSQFDLEDLEHLVVFEKNDIPSEMDSVPNDNLQVVRRFLRAPTVVPTGTGYEVELSAAKLGTARTVRWQIEFGSSGIRHVADKNAHGNTQRIYSYNENEKIDRSKPNITEIFFIPGAFAQGLDADTSNIDMQSWNASDGPGVERSRYYFDSHEKAEHRMQDYMKDAVSVIDEGPWTNSKGETVGKRVTAILIYWDKKQLIAVKLYEDDRSVLMIESFCLRNLLAFAK
jgi:hypothetical protein